MVISEVALAVVALVGAVLFVKSFERARAVDPGFSPDGVWHSKWKPTGRYGKRWCCSTSRWEDLNFWEFIVLAAASGSS
jgi:hypothetical protein